MKTKYTCYTIDDRSMEEDCPWCAVPLYTGDTAWELEGFGEGFCSRHCLDRSLSSSKDFGRAEAIA